MNVKVSETEQRLTATYGPYLDTQELATVLKYSGRHSVLEQVRKGKFPIKTFRLGSKRVADTRDVAKYLDEQRDAA